MFVRISSVYMYSHLAVSRRERRPRPSPTVVLLVILLPFVVDAGPDIYFDLVVFRMSDYHF